MRPSRLVLCALFALAASCNCGGGRLVFSGGGTLRVTLFRADARASTLEVVLETNGLDPVNAEAAIASVPMETDVPGLKPGSYTARVVARGADGAALGSVLVTDVEILAKHLTEIVIDFSTGGAPAAEACDGADNDGDGETDEALDLALCTLCTAGAEVATADDARCGAIDCSGLDGHALRGDNTAAGSDKRCVKTAHPPLTESRCLAAGRCVDANGPACGPGAEAVLAQGGLCQTIAGCEAGAPSVQTSPDGTPCGPGQACQGGQCRGPTTPSAGCADGTREGFTSLSSYPDIAACSGAWTVPGVTRPALVPTCGRASGNSGANADGAGCSAADLCAEGWHVCAGKDEVGQKAGSCTDAVPPGAPDKSLFFAVGQASQSNSTCDSAGDNDVFGCGNLGTQLTPVRNCGVLTRALASTQAQSCGFNEAEPNLGPWQCLGGADSHFHEGALVTKHGCPGGGCSYDGRAVSNADKGGVLCCRD